MTPCGPSGPEHTTEDDLMTERLWHDLRAAAGDLGATERQALAAALSGRRDQHAAQQPRLAAFYNALAVVVADVSDEETRTLRLLSDGGPTTPAA
jgi:hypothetical protein